MQWNAIEPNKIAQFRIEDDAMTRGGGTVHGRIASRRIAPSPRNRDITTPHLAPRRADDQPRPPPHGGSPAAASEVMMRGDGIGAVR